MQFVLTYEFTGSLSKARINELLELFAEFGEAPGTTSHLMRADGRGGFSVVEFDDASVGQRAVIPYLDFVDFSLHPVVPVETGVGNLIEYAAG